MAETDERPEDRPADLDTTTTPADAATTGSADPAAASPDAAAEAAPDAAAPPGPAEEDAAPRPSGTDAAAGEDPPAEPAGPPAHSALREDDFAFEACRLELRRLGTAYTVEAPVTGDERDCGIDRPLKVTAILPGVALEGGALMRCDTARALAWWVRDVVRPAAIRLPGAPRATSLALGSTYQCRATVGASTSKLSEHALGNAIDIAAFTFDDGTTLPVEGADAGNAAQAFLLAVRWAACMDFATVLGPGSNAAHENHLHLDIKARRGGYRVCE